ncbi:hypothetical protein EVAR_85498_1 [Eumeta japonica]|uniref:Uncharacterized protein n=1 Tax=Eumeta variegata TaxID=151549 RepID=A0A4C1VCJ5_EUMVA|nr:hypothetical protein EVAR_85498_1 [Eumeta japonica]
MACKSSGVERERDISFSSIRFDDCRTCASPRGITLSYALELQTSSAMGSSAVDSSERRQEAYLCTTKAKNEVGSSVSTRRSHDRQSSQSTTELYFGQITR